MIEMLKKMAMQKLSEKMGANSLSSEATGEAATEGASALVDKIKAAVGSGNMDQVKDLFSSEGQEMGENGIFNDVKSKMSEILQAKGMTAEEAEAEAGNATPDLINNLKEKFESKAEGDSGFDISSLTGLIGGDAGNMINKVKNLF